MYPVRRLTMIFVVQFQRKKKGKINKEKNLKKHVDHTKEKA